MITTINEFKQHLTSINEVRIPTGQFKVTNSFLLPDAENWDVVFSDNDILNIVPSERKIFKWNSSTSKWDLKDIDWKKFMEPSFYLSFKNNTSKLDAEGVSKGTGIKPESNNIEFVATVKNIDRKLKQLELEPEDKLKVKVI